MADHSDSPNTKFYTAPDGSYHEAVLDYLSDVRNNTGATSTTASILYSDYQSTLADSSVITSGWLDMADYDKVQFSGYSDTAGMTVRIESKVNDTDAPTQLDTPVTYSDGGFYLFNVICRQRFMRFSWENSTGGTVNDASIEIKGFIGSSDKLSVFPLSVQPSNFSQASLVQSVIRGADINGIYRNVTLNTGGAILNSNFLNEVARGNVPTYSMVTKFGRNPSINTGTTPEDIHEGGGVYTGFNATANQNIQVLSSSGNDTGTVVSSGTVTGGSDFTLIDSSATFVSDGVAVGDCVVNDTDASHGFVTSVDSETQLTVFRMTNGAIAQGNNSSGDSYRVVNSNGTGASVLRVDQLLNSNYETQTAKYVVLNGTSTVTVTGDYMRCTRCKVIASGSNGNNVGTLTVRQATTTSNVFAQIQPNTGQTQISCYTVPNGKVASVERLSFAITRSNGSAGSATVEIQSREPFGAWRSVRTYEMQTGSILNPNIDGGITFTEGYDIRVRVKDVSDNGTVAQAEFEMILNDE